MNKVLSALFLGLVMVFASSCGKTKVEDCTKVTAEKECSDSEQKTGEACKWVKDNSPGANAGNCVAEAKK